MEAFTADQVERGRRYHRPRYLAQLLSFGITIVVLGALAFTGLGDWLLPGWSWWAQALVYPAIVLALLQLAGLPIAFWSGYLHERQWGLSTQTASGWLGDALKAFLVSTAIGTLLLFGLVATARATDAWPLVAAPAGALVVVLLAFIAPVVLEPIFNKFRPVDDDEVVAGIRAVSEQAGVPVRDVLVADASRRTKKENAYVSGFGKTRRVVVYDTLLEQAKPAELRAVIAHELAHRRYRDVLNLALILVAAVVGLVLLLWAILGAEAGDPRTIPVVMLVVTVAQPLLVALVAALSRRWEYRADRFALDVTRDSGALESAFRRLVESNVSDLEPPRLVYYLKYTHPTVPERIAAIRAAAGQEAT